MLARSVSPSRGNFNRPMYSLSASSRSFVLLMATSKGTSSSLKCHHADSAASAAAAFSSSLASGNCASDHDSSPAWLGGRIQRA